MGDRLFGALDIGLAFGVAIGLGLWQLVAVRRGLRRDREAGRRDPDGR